MGDLYVIHHAAADESDFAADAGGDVNHLLDAMDGRSEARKDDAAGSGATELFDARDDIALGAGETGAFHVGGIGKKSENAFMAVSSEGVKIERSAADRRLINFEVTGVNDHAGG